MIKGNFATKQNKRQKDVLQTSIGSDSQVVFDSKVQSLNIECGDLNQDEHTDNNIYNLVKNVSNSKCLAMDSKSIKQSNHLNSLAMDSKSVKQSNHLSNNYNTDSLNLNNNTQLRSNANQTNNESIDLT